MTTTTRRAVLAGLATVPVVDIWRPAQDPIFAAIEAHRAAHTAYCLHVRDDKNEESEAEGSRLSDVADGLAYDLASIEPTTAAGVAALLSYFAERTASGGQHGQEFPEGGHDQDSGRFQRFEYFIAQNAASALRKLIAREEASL